MPHRFRSALLVVWLIAWAIVHAQLSWRTAPPARERSFNSPDEMANNFFARRVAERRLLPAAAPLGNLAGGIVHPRATAVYRGKLVPLSFLGLPFWYGMAGRVTGGNVLPYLTPVLALVGSWACYRLLQEIFGAWVAWRSAALLPILPPWWYYSSRGMFHNVPFVALLLIGGWCLLQLYRHGRRLDGILAGISLGMALTFRTVEAFWVVPLLIAAFVWCPPRRKRVWWLVGVGIVAAWLPILVLQAATYGSPLRFGYLLPSAVDAVPGGTAPAVRSVGDLLPYGFHPRRAWGNALRFTFGMLPWVFWLALAGLASVVGTWRRQPKPRRWYVVAGVAVAAVLFTYYGGARLNDTLDPAATTLGVSYVRYWLPLYVAILPFTVLGIRWIGDRFRNRMASRMVVVALLALVAGLSARVTVAEPREGLRAVVRAITTGYQKRAKVSRIVPPGSVIVAERSDKVFFPTYPVVGTLLDDRVQRNLGELISARPVYYYTFFNDLDLVPLQQQLGRLHLALTFPTIIASSAGSSPERLFRIEGR